MRRRGERVIDPDEVWADAVVEHYLAQLTTGSWTLRGDGLHHVRVVVEVLIVKRRDNPRP